MQCDEVLKQLNAWLDGELSAAEADKLDDHLAACSECRADAEAIQTMNEELRRAFVPRHRAAQRLTEVAVAAVHASAVAPASIAPPVAAAPRFAWKQALAGLAAGFLLAVALFRPWQPRSVAPQSPPMPPPIAHLAVASAPVEVRPAGQLDVYRCPSGGSIGADSIVRTGALERCEIELENGNALRLDCNTEVTLHEPDVVEVSKGRLCSNLLPGAEGFELQWFGCPIVAKEPAQVAIECQSEAARVIVVDGTVDVRTGDGSIEVGPGKLVRIAQGRVEKAPESCDALLETAWVNSVLALRSSEHPELVERINWLLAKIGREKLSVLYEDELRRLGDAGVPPLLAYLAATRETPNIAQRATAARIVADVAESRWIADLIALLTDANADVRLHAARGLERLTGRDQGLAAQVWQSGPWVTCEPAHQKWLDWWAENRDRYPTARRDNTAPKTPPF